MCGRDYEGLDPADLQSPEFPLSPHDYTGLDTGLDEHGYIVVMG